MEATVKITGFKEAQKALDVLPDRFQRQTILKMLRKSTRPMIRAAKTNLLNYGSSYSNLAKSIGNITAKSKNPIIYVGPRMRGKFRMVAYISHWVEYGTKGIKTSGGSSKKKAQDNDFVFVAKIPRGGRYREDQPAKPFMRPAIDGNKMNVAGMVKDNFDKHLQKSVNQAVAKMKR